MRQSLNIINQCLSKIPKGSIKFDFFKIATPFRKDLKISMEAIIHHFKLYSEGFFLNSKEVYCAVEAPKGEFLRHEHIICQFSRVKNTGQYKR